MVYFERSMILTSSLPVNAFAYVRKNVTEPRGNNLLNEQSAAINAYLATLGIMVEISSLPPDDCDETDARDG